MKTYQKCEIAKQRQDKIKSKYIEKYFAEKDTDKPAKGQLKFLDGVIVRNLAASTRVRMRKESFIKFLDKEILGNRDEVISFMDYDMNMKAFLDSAYGEIIIARENYKESFGFPMFLLIQKAQEVMERKLLAYLNLEQEDEEESNEESEKKRAYVELLYSIAIYEIFVKDYWKEISDLLPGESSDLAKEIIMEKVGPLIQKYEGSSDVQEQEAAKEKLLQWMKNYNERCDAIIFHECFYLFAFKHLWNFMAVLRLIGMIEFVNINEMYVGEGNRAGNKQKEMAKKAQRWDINISSWFEDKEFFTLPRRNPNFNGWYKEITQIEEDYCLLAKNPEESDLDYNHFRSCVQEYIKCIEKHNVLERTKEEEKHLWAIQVELGGRVLGTLKAMENMKR